MALGFSNGYFPLKGFPCERTETEREREKISCPIREHEKKNQGIL